MNVKFHDDIATHAPTCCLIEDYWMLQKTLNYLANGDILEAKEEISCVMECIAETIDRHTKMPAGLGMEPSVFLPIAMCIDNGIITNDGTPLRCKAGECLSNIGGSTCVACQYCRPNYAGSECDPESGHILLENDVLYDATGDGEEFVAALEQSE